MRNPENIKQGDIVYLKSGSPAMIVDEAKEINCICFYFSNGEIKSIKLSYASITKTKPSANI